MVGIEKRLNIHLDQGMKSVLSEKGFVRKFVFGSEELRENLTNFYKLWGEKGFAGGADGNFFKNQG